MKAPTHPPTHRARQRTTAARDASMTLLNEVMQRPLDPGYAAAAHRRQQNQDGDRTRRRHIALTVVLAATAGALLVAAVADLRLPTQIDSRAVLTEEVNSRTTEVEALEEQVAALQAEIDQIGESALTGAADKVVDRSQLLAQTTGAAPVVGPGVRVVLEDAEVVEGVGGPDPREVDSDAGRVKDLDLQTVVNGLWASGAEAIAINDQRLTATSSIREAGSAVLVNFRPLTPPYEVEAIGDPARLQVGFASSAAGRYMASLENYGIRTSFGRVENLELPGAPGLRLRYAAPPASSPAPGPADATIGARPDGVDASPSGTTSQETSEGSP